MPRAEVFGGERAPCVFFDVPVDLVRAHIEEGRPPSPLQRADDFVCLGVDDRLDAPLAALRRIVEDEHAVPRELDVLPLERREPVAAMLVGVLLAAHTEEAAIKQPDGTGKLAPLPSLAQVCRGSRAQVRQGARECEHLVELLLVAALAPAVVVPVLTPPRSIGADGLQVTGRIGADPDIGPGGRERERTDALERHRIVDPPAVGVEVLEATSAPAAGDPGRGAIGVVQVAHGPTTARAAAPLRSVRCFAVLVDQEGAGREISSTT